MCWHKLWCDHPSGPCDCGFTDKAEKRGRRLLEAEMVSDDLRRQLAALEAEVERLDEVEVWYRDHPNFLPGLGDILARRKGEDHG